MIYGNSYQAEALTSVTRYHTCSSSHPEDRKLPITELKWDAGTLTDIPGITAKTFTYVFTPSGPHGGPNNQIP
jgi:hypothetical protein